MAELYKLINPIKYYRNLYEKCRCIWERWWGPICHI